MTDSNPRPGARSWMPAALFVSLAINLFFAGLILGSPMLFGGPDGGRGGRDPVVSLVPNPRMFIEILGKEDGRRVLREMRANVPDLREKFRAMRKNHEAVVAAMRADPYDPEALARAFQTVRASHIDFTTSIQEPLVNVLGDLTPRQREMFAEAFSRMARHRGRGPDRDRSGEDGPPELPGRLEDE